MVKICQCKRSFEEVLLYYDDEKQGKLGSSAIKRVAVGAHLSTPWLFEPRRESRLLPGLQFPPQVEAPGTRFYTSGVGRALWANSGEGSAQ